ncbi:MAG: tryptophan--tRNA ligase [Candidatus Liptonbacteria bacterium RIFCSPLOWO2_01_FULL_56_20]|uniref:Tryptophan--tRNA ligase n=1 Tax=Candidatus Liptonbacteria bacterium RIFCSPLOWO2_01_FULL_56_20 TaxID=1798652 RepID=A0A1G2CHI7_9BACT|nr:MAG: tryptophan--tRNA ligase [Candidatus Liptonbacteria bacterium RIFCSPHIGHO2_01_FULL_56_18b]OGZ00863.1 MAG: tryptophan--tRNA ligase [Candidatus Liptonbacteria bacterium RIFCSPLOWO2_01_FULL_56_20]
MPKPVLISGVQPTGRLHVGNYLGALKNFVELQNSGKYSCYFFIADLHSLTEDFDPKEKPEQTLNLLADFLAAGLDPKKSVLFLQSRIPAHSELAWILNTITPIGELRRMTQYKEKLLARVPAIVEKGILQDGVDMREFENAGLFDYPVLMAADILLYDAKFVPVGEDQLQHLELTRTLARKFNAKFGKTFVEPQPLLTKTPRVMSLSNPEKKMSKSEPTGCLFIDEEDAEFQPKIMSAVTDSGSDVKYDPDKKPGVSNLLTIYAALKDIDIPEVEGRFKGKSYVEFKSDVCQAIHNEFVGIRMKKKELVSKREFLRQVLLEGSKKAAEIANKKIEEVKKRLGLTA